MNSNNVCGASGTTAAVIKVHCLCSVSCCLAMEQETLQRNFSRKDGRKNVNKISCFDDGTDEVGKVQVSSGQCRPAFVTLG